MSSELGKANFFDLTQLDTLRRGAQKDEKGSLLEVTRQFESLFVKTWLKTMRDANAVFDATGVRLRTIPFTPESVLTALKGAGAKTA